MADNHDNAHAEEGHGKGHGGGGHGGHGHGGGHEEAHEGAPEWLISFADNVALLMGFFVILLAMNMQKPTAGGIGGENKNPSTVEAYEADWVIGLRQAFNSPIDLDSENPAEAALRKRLRERNQKGDTLQPGPSGDKHNVQAPRTSDYVNITATILFADGESTLSGEGAGLIAEAAEHLKGTVWIIEVRGHASAAETMRDKEKSMRLAFDRAFAVAQELVRAGVPWERLRPAACADNDRVQPAARDLKGNRANQRAEIVVTTEAMAADPYAAGRGRE